MTTLATVSAPTSFDNRIFISFAALLVKVTTLLCVTHAEKKAKIEQNKPDQSENAAKASRHSALGSRQKGTLHTRVPPALPLPPESTKRPS